MTVPNPSQAQPDDDQATCPVCPHRRTDHDAIANRFCSARIAGNSGQGCVCRPTG